METVEQFVRRQMDGYAHLQGVNNNAFLNGEMDFLPLPEIVWETVTDYGEPSIVMTDLTAGGTLGMIDLKRLLAPDINVNDIAFWAGHLWPDFSTEDRRWLARESLKVVERNAELVRRYGVVFIQDPEVMITTYPHQFSSWAVIVTGNREFHLVIHDFSSTYPLADLAQCNEIQEGLQEARRIWI
ncbi:hypothetical protein ACFLZ1_04740 [Patescibacteria group bacterium]